MWLLCRCGHHGSVDWDMSKSTLRKDVLPNARCARCGHVGAVDMRLYWEPYGAAMEGSRVPEQTRKFTDSFTVEEDF